MDNKVNYTVTATDLLSGKLKGMEGSANSLESTMASLNNKINQVGAALGIAFGIQQIKQFGEDVINAGITVENATTGLTTLLGDSAQAAMVVKNTMEDATKTPFAFEGLLQANKALIAAGVGADQARTDVLNLSNAIAATGGGDDELGRMVVNMQQIRNTGKATAQDIKQFAFAGVNIYKVLADATGQPIEKVKDMEVSYDLLTMALAKAHEKGGAYFNGLENMANNTSVRISNVGDAVFQAYVEIFQKIKPYVDGALSFITESVMNVKDNIGNAFSAIGNFLKPLFKPFSDFFDKIYVGFGKIFTALSKFSGEGGTLLVFLRNTLGDIITGLGLAIEVILDFAANVIDVMHTIYVIADKLGVVWLISKVFELVWRTLKIIGGLLLDLYNNVIKPIFDGILWAYEKVKKLLGIKDEKKTITVATKLEDESGNSLTKGLGGIAKMPSSSIAKAKAEKGSHAGSGKPVTINIKIGSLIHDFKISTTNIQESTKAIHEKVVMALTAAVNDSQIVAGN